MAYFTAFMQAYVACLLWTGTNGDDVGTPLDSLYTHRNIDLASMRRIWLDCQMFVSLESEYLPEDATRAGHLFALSRNRHGAGFWDSDLADAGRLQARSEWFGEAHLILIDHGGIFDMLDYCAS